MTPSGSAGRRHRSRTAYLAFTGIVGLLAVLPLLGVLAPSWYSLLIGTFVFALYAMSWDLLGGYAGQINLGHALFVGVAAYASGLLSLRLGWSPAATIPLGMLASVGVGALVGAPAVRLRGPYLALTTLIALIAAEKLVLIYSDVTGGSSGLNFTPRSFFPPLGYAVPLDQVRLITYYYALGLLALVGLVLVGLAHSKWGAVFEAIREDEAAVEAAGINPAKFKITAFMVSGAAAGLAGAAYVHLPTLAGVQPAGPGGVLNLDLSLLIIVACVVGGLGTMIGPLVGAFFIVIGQALLSELPRQVEVLRALEWQGQGWITLIFLIVLVMLVLFAPRGLWPTVLGRAMPGPQLGVKWGGSRRGNR